MQDSDVSILELPSLEEVFSETACISSRTGRYNAALSCAEDEYRVKMPAAAQRNLYLQWRGLLQDLPVCRRSGQETLSLLKRVAHHS